MNKPSRKVPALIEPLEHNRVTQAILDFVSDVPTSKVSSSSHPDAEAQRLGKRAAQRAALTAGSLALPPGPLGWLTLLPELTLIWKIQGQMVSDIVTKADSMLSCLTLTSKLPVPTLSDLRDVLHRINAAFADSVNDKDTISFAAGVLTVPN